MEERKRAESLHGKSPTLRSPPLSRPSDLQFEMDDPDIDLDQYNLEDARRSPEDALGREEEPSEPLHLDLVSGADGMISSESPKKLQLMQNILHLAASPDIEASIMKHPRFQSAVSLLADEKTSIEFKEGAMKSIVHDFSSPPIPLELEEEGPPPGNSFSGNVDSHPLESRHRETKEDEHEKCPKCGEIHGCTSHRRRNQSVGSPGSPPRSQRPSFTEEVDDEFSSYRKRTMLEVSAAHVTIGLVTLVVMANLFQSKGNFGVSKLLMKSVHGFINLIKFSDSSSQ